MLALILASATEQAAVSSHIDFIGIIRDLLSIVSISAGLFFVLAGTLGVLRLPDFYTRLHAAGMLSLIHI